MNDTAEMERHDKLRATEGGRIRREEEGVVIEEFDPDRAPSARDYLRDLRKVGR